MRTKTNSGSVVLKAAAIVLGACLTIIGMTSASGDFVTILKLAGAEGGFVSFAKTLDELPPWYNTALALAGLLLIGGILNGVESRGRNHSALNSKLIRRPVQRMFLLFLAPTFAAFCIGFLYPFVRGIFLSFCRFKTTSKWTWVGFDNYINAFQDSTFVHAFWYTALFALVSLLLINVLSFAVAYALTRGIKGTNIFRTVFFMPNLIGGIVLGYIWAMIFDGILLRYGTSILLKTEYGFWGLQILMAWQQIGYMMIIYIAGLPGRAGGYPRSRAHRRRKLMADAVEGHDPERHAVHHYMHLPHAHQFLQALRPEPRAHSGPSIRTVRGRDAQNNRNARAQYL